jgi:P27 family predicted phage terminase small subunit
MEGYIPKDICPEATQYMKELIKKLEEQGILTSLDQFALTLLANTYHLYIEASKIVKKEGIVITSKSGEKKNHPAVKTMIDAGIQIKKFEDSFGLNPKARKEIAQAKDKDKKKSPLDNFFEGKIEVR